MTIGTLFAHGVMHAGGGVIDQLTAPTRVGASMVVGMEWPTAGELMRLGRMGYVNEYDTQESLLRVGVAADWDHPIGPVVGLGSSARSRNAWNNLFYASQERGGHHEMFTVANRQLWPDTQVASYLSLYDFYDEDWRKWWANLRYEIPSSSDLVRFSVRHVFEPDLIAKLGYNNEFRPILDLWHRFQGLNYPIFTGPFKQQVAQYEAEKGLPPGSFFASYVEQGLADPTWAQAFWWSHWVLPSPSQGYLAYFRLRPDRDKRYDGPEALGVNFSYDDLTLLLRANDYPLKYRNMLAAIARPIPGVRFARDFRANGVYDEPALFEWALRQGYSDKDAGDIATDIDTWATRRENKETTCRGCNVVEKAYEVGIIDRGQMQALFSKLGVPAKEAAARADLVDVDLKSRRALEVVRSLRRQYLAGKIGDQQAQILLAQYGLVAVRIDEYLSDWKLEKATNFKEIAAQKAIKWACQGIVAIDDLVKRLTNLGYQQPDIAGMVAEAELCALTIAARAAAAVQKAAEKQARALIAAQKAAAQAITQARRALASHGSPAQLRKWFCEGNIGQPELYSRLQFLGWPDIDIARLVADCKTGKGKSRGGATGPGGTAGP